MRGELCRRIWLLFLFAPDASPSLQCTRGCALVFFLFSVNFANCAHLSCAHSPKTCQTVLQLRMSSYAVFESSRKAIRGEHAPSTLVRRSTFLEEAGERGCEAHLVPYSGRAQHLRNAAVIRKMQEGGGGLQGPMGKAMVCSRFCGGAQSAFREKVEGYEYAKSAWSQ